MWKDVGIEEPRSELAVIIGRFQPGPHYGHMGLFEAAANIAPNILTLIGSSFIARNIKNPFTFDEREEMILAGTKHLNRNINCEGIGDRYSNQNWVAQVQVAVQDEIDMLGISSPRVVIVGHKKDASSYYLDMFPGYRLHEIESRGDISSTHLRKSLFGSREIVGIDGPVKEYLEKWTNKNPEIFENLCGEYRFLENYKKQFLGLKYPPIFVTTDAVVICNGHILLVRRRSHPGKGLWALPGGFLKENETIQESLFRELDEETHLDFPNSLLKASLKGTHVFDAPGRSLRGRTITHAGLILLENCRYLPKIRADDDAEAAKWFPLSDFYQMSHVMFEDHHMIGMFMVNRT
jgi:bifunctional NMN adenylyltransferase/nudix hydrolase